MKRFFGLFCLFLCFLFQIGLAENTIEMPPEDFDVIFALESARAESPTPLTTQLKMGSDPLGYDREWNTFYCTLGMEQGDWPELPIRTDRSDIHLIWLDDPTYDDCSEAIASGTAYEVFCYNESAYCRFQIVFTGLPVIVISLDGNVLNGREDIPCTVTVSAAGQDTIRSQALIHQRGGSDRMSKDSYRLELTRLSDSGKTKKNKLSLLGMQKDDDWLLLSNKADFSRVANYLSFRLWNEYNGGQEFGQTDSRLAELFVDDCYRGVYQLMTPISVKTELEKKGWTPEQSLVGRQCLNRGTTGKPQRPLSVYTGLVCRIEYKPESMSEDDAFYTMENYYRLERCGGGLFSDETFSKLAVQTLDLPSMMRYFVFVNATDSTDNIGTYNNYFLWAHSDDSGNWKFFYSPWDMDCSLFNYTLSEEDKVYLERDLITSPLYRRLLQLNVGGCREILRQVFNESMCSSLSPQNITGLFLETQDLMNRSGAYKRNRDRFFPENEETLDLEKRADLISRRYDTMRWYFDEYWPLDEAVTE